MSIKNLSLLLIFYCLSAIYGCQTKPLIFSLETDKSIINVSSMETNESITITSNESWTITGIEGDWLKVYPTSGKKGKNKISIDCNQNNSVEGRGSRFYIKSGDVTIEIKINQQPKKVFNILEREYEVLEFGDEINVAYSSNIPLAPTIASGAEWLRLASTKAVVESYLKIIVLPLNSDIIRTGIINFIDEEGNKIDSLKIVQTTKNYANKCVLEKFFNSTNGTHWMNNTNWLSDKPLSEWYGIQMYGNEIIEINLQNNNLTGTIPLEISKLKRIEVLNLWGNKLGGEIPSSIGSLKSLRRLYLSNNELSGSVPDSLYSLQNLKELSLSNNFGLSFNLVNAIDRLNSIELLALDNTVIASEIPSQIGNRGNLSFFSASGCRLTGDIPGSIYNLINLEYLSLNNNSLTGTISPSIGNLKKLTTLNFAGNNLSGQIPIEMYALKNLSALIIYQNFFTGNIPYSLSKLPNWSGFNASTNVIPQKNGINLSLNGYIKGDFLFDSSGDECGVVYLLTNESGTPLSDQNKSSMHGYAVKNSINNTVWSRLYVDTPADDYNFGKENVESVLRFIEQNRLSLDDFPVFKWCRNENTGEEINWYIPSPAEALKISPLTESINQSFKIIDKNLLIDNKIITSYDGNNKDFYISIGVIGSSINNSEDKKSPCKAILISRF